MNGVDAVALATGNDWRAIEAGAHAYACRNGAYRPLTTWHVDGETLVGAMALPMAVSTVGPLATMHPRVALALRLLGSPSARELAAVIASVGLVSNLAALRSLGCAALARHRRDSGRTHGAARTRRGAGGGRTRRGRRSARRRLVREGNVKIDRAREFLARR